MTVIDHSNSCKGQKIPHMIISRYVEKVSQVQYIFMRNIPNKQRIEGNFLSFTKSIYENPQVVLKDWKLSLKTRKKTKSSTFTYSGQHCVAITCSLDMKTKQNTSRLERKK